MADYDRLSPQDSVFLHVEDDHQPLHVGALGYFERGPFLGADGRFDLARVRKRIESRLHLVPRFRKRIMTVPFDQGRPIWVDDVDFDLAYHVRLTAIPPPGSEAQLKLLMDRVQAQLLDRRRPLWEIWFVEGVDDDRVALIQKTHHALIDGISGIDVATVLLDLEPDVPDVDPEPWTATPPPDASALLVDSLVERAVEPAELVRSARAAVRGPQNAAERLGQVARTMVDLAQRTPSAPWNVPVTPHRRFEPARVPLDRAKAIRRAASDRGADLDGTTLNDVVLAACAGAMRTYLVERGDDVPEGLVYRAMVPVSVRDVSEQMALGNRVSMMTADLPVGDPDPIERLRFVHAHMASRKEMGQAVGADSIMEVSGYAPPTLLGLAARLAVRTMPLNTVITNIPGPQIPLYCMGSRMLEAFPYVCVVDGMAMIIAVISYDGHLAFGLSGDRSAMPDLHVLAESVEEAFTELEEALTVTAEPPPKAKAKPKDAAKPKGAKKAAARKTLIVGDGARPWPTVRALADAVRAGERSARDAVEVALAAAAADDDLEAFVVLDPDAARAAADAVDAAVARGDDPGPLAGVPIGVKDLEDCAGMPTGHGSLLYRGRGPIAADSIHVARLRAAGAVPIGKTAAPEFGILSWTRTRWATTRNPWDPTRTPGGSSGGSAAAVSAGLVPMATASDGGGSIRSPAGFTGLVGHKGSFGRIPLPTPMGWMTSVVGALTTTVGDAARHLDVACGPDPRDRTSLPAPGLSYETVVETLATAGLRARWSPDLGFAAVDPEVAAVARAAAEALAGAADLDLDDDPVAFTDPVETWLGGGAIDTWLSLEPGMWPARAGDLAPYTRWSLEQGETDTVASLVDPARGRAVLEREVGELLSEVDVLLTPTVAVPAFAAEGPPPAEIAGRTVHPAMATPFGMLANLCWLPSTSVPAGLTAAGLPVGLMITGGQHRDDLTLRLARLLEHTRPWPRWAPARA